MSHLVLLICASAVLTDHGGIAAGDSSLWCGSGDVIPNYSNITGPKIELSVPQAHGICVNQNSGDFAVISTNTEERFRLFDKHAKLLKTAVLPPGSRPKDCAFSSSAIYISDPGSKRLLKYTTSGDFITSIANDVFYYDRLVWCNSYLYATVPPLGVVAVFYNDKEIQRFNITKGIAGRGDLSFDSHGKLYVTVQPKQVQMFNSRGKPTEEFTFNEVGIVNGLVVDGGNNFVITDYMVPADVFVFSPQRVLIKTIKGVGANDVDIGVDGTILFAVMYANKVILY